jgi:hypothetical protein
MPPVVPAVLGEEWGNLSSSIAITELPEQKLLEQSKSVRPIPSRSSIFHPPR